MNVPPYQSPAAPALLVDNHLHDTTPKPAQMYEDQLRGLSFLRRVHTPCSPRRNPQDVCVVGDAESRTGGSSTRSLPEAGSQARAGMGNDKGENVDDKGKWRGLRLQPSAFDRYGGGSPGVTSTVGFAAQVQLQCLIQCNGNIVRESETLSDRRSYACTHPHKCNGMRAWCTPSCMYLLYVRS
jgi:hypothetical protein